MPARPSDPRPAGPGESAEESEAHDPYEARLDAELLRMEEPAAVLIEEREEAFDRAHERGLGRYLELYTASTPWWVWARRVTLMWFAWAMSPAGWSGPLRAGTILGAVLIEGFASFVWRGLRRPKREADPVSTTTEPGASTARAVPGSDEDARDEARLDAELERLDGGK